MKVIGDNLVWIAAVVILTLPIAGSAWMISAHQLKGRLATSTWIAATFTILLIACALSAIRKGRKDSTRWWYRQRQKKEAAKKRLES